MIKLNSLLLLISVGLPEASEQESTSLNMITASIVHYINYFCSVLDNKWL
jgi:hypothetical protein